MLVDGMPSEFPPCVQIVTVLIDPDEQALVVCCRDGTVQVISSAPGRDCILLNITNALVMTLDCLTNDIIFTSTHLPQHCRCNCWVCQALMVLCSFSLGKRRPRLGE